MKTTIMQGEGGKPVLCIEGENAPESIAQEFLKVQEILRSAETKEKEKKTE